MNFCACCESIEEKIEEEIEKVIESEKVLVSYCSDNDHLMISDYVMLCELLQVFCATGKVGKNVCRALVDKGFDVYGTTRQPNSKLKSIRVTPILCDYTQEKDLVSAFRRCGAKKAFIITDFFLAAKSSIELEIQQGRAMVDACKRAGCEYVVYSSAADADLYNDKVKHMKGKVAVETYLQSSGLNNTILRPAAFFENFDDPSWNPLTKGRVKFLTLATTKFCATLDIGKAAAVCFKNPQAYNGQTINVQSWEGNLAEVAKALEKVSGDKTTFSAAFPCSCLRALILPDLHHMCLHFGKRSFIIQLICCYMF